MTWNKVFCHLPQYEWVSSNQYGNRYKKCKTKVFSVARLSCQTDDVNGMRNLILLSHTLDVPVRYDFSSKPQQVYIEVVSAEKIKEK